MIREEFTEASKCLGIQSSILKLNFLKISDTFPQCGWPNTFQKWPSVLSLQYDTTQKVLKCQENKEGKLRLSKEIVKNVHYSEIRAG